MRIITVVLAVLCTTMSINSMAQSEEKFKRNLKLTITPKFDQSQSISFDHKVENKHGFDKVLTEFTKAFEGNGFKVTNINPKFLITMDYKYGYAIYAYKMQYSNLVGEVLDSETKEIVATFSYYGNYNNDTMGEALAKALLTSIKN